MDWGNGKGYPISNVHKVRGWPATATWSAKTCPDLHLMPTSYEINFFMSWRHPSTISCSIPLFQTIKQPKNTALNHPEARKFEAFSRLEDMSSVKTIRMDWYTLIQMTKTCISYVYRFILYKYKSEKCVSICFCEAKLPSCTALSPYSAAAFLVMHSAHWHTESWSESRFLWRFPKFVTCLNRRDCSTDFIYFSRTNSNHSEACPGRDSRDPKQSIKWRIFTTPRTVKELSLKS